MQQRNMLRLEFQVYYHPKPFIEKKKKKNNETGVIPIFEASRICSICTLWHQNV